MQQQTISELDSSLVFLDFLDLSDSGIFKIVDLNNAAISLVLPGRERKAVGCFL